MRHSRERLGIRIEGRRLVDGKRFGEQISQSGKGAAAWNQAIAGENVQVCFHIFAISPFSVNLS